MRDLQIGAARLILADAREVADLVLAADAIITDPPYGIGVYRLGQRRRMGVAGCAAALTRGSPRIHGDDTPFDPRPWSAHPDAVLWGADHYRDRLPPGGRFLAWDKLAGSTSWDSYSDVEFAWHTRAGKSEVVSHLWKGAMCDRTGERGDNGRRFHPMQKPRRVMSWSIARTDARPGALVADPYMGAGTTGLAALAAGYRFLGVEIDPRWFELARARIAEAAVQTALALEPQA